MNNVLNDKKIKQLIQDKTIKIDPYQESHVNPASYDLSLSGIKSLTNPEYERCEHKDAEGIIEILPDESFLAGTVEFICLPNNIASLVVNKSSTFRKGLMLGSSGWIDPGYNGTLTALLKNVTHKTIKLRYTQPLFNCIFFELEPVENAYNGHYQNSKDIVDDKS